MTLFSSYEFTKRLLFDYTVTSYTDYVGMFSISLAGGISGICQTLASYYFQEIEQKKLSKTALRSLTNLPKPPLNYIFSISTILPSMLGFLAYEYSKDVFQINYSKKVRFQDKKEID